MRASPVSSCASPCGVCFPVVSTATETRSQPRVSSATWLSIRRVPEPQPPLKYRCQPRGKTCSIPRRGKDDVREQAQRGRPVAWRDRRVDAQEEGGLVARAHVRFTPYRLDRDEARHACAICGLAAACPPPRDGPSRRRTSSPSGRSDHSRWSGRYACKRSPVADRERDVAPTAAGMGTGLSDMRVPVSYGGASQMAGTPRRCSAEPECDQASGAKSQEGMHGCCSSR